MDTTPVRKNYSLRETVQIGADLLASQGIASPLLESELLLAHTIGCERSRMYALSDDHINHVVSHRFLRLINLRLRKRIPIAYLTGEKWFYMHRFHVTPDVLIPRPETEMLVEMCLEELRQRGGKTHRMLEIGTGSGAIAISVASHALNVDVKATDYSHAALNIAKNNAQRLLEDRVDTIEFVHSDLFDQIGEDSFDIICSNPPYIAAEDIATLPDDVRWEPRLALEGGQDGAKLLAKIVAEAPLFLNDGGILLLEMGADQASDLENLARKTFGHQVKVHHDLAGHPRMLVARKENMVC